MRGGCSRYVREDPSHHRRQEHLSLRVYLYLRATRPVRANLARRADPEYKKKHMMGEDRGLMC